MLRYRLMITALAIGLGACGGDAAPGAPSGTGPTGGQPQPPTKTENPVAAAKRLRPADPQLAQIYQRTCYNCHATGAVNAPLTGNAEAWAARLEKGMPTLLKSTTDGFRGMPPKGLCFDCSEAEFTELILFMTNQTGQADSNNDSQD